MLDPQDRSLLLSIITDLVDVTSKMGPMLLYNAGFSERDWRTLRQARVPKRGREGTRRLTKKEIAYHILDHTKDEEIEGVFRRLVSAAAKFERFDLSRNRERARSVADQAMARERRFLEEDRTRRAVVDGIGVDPGRSEWERQRGVLLSRFEELQAQPNASLRGRLLEVFLNDLCHAQGLKAVSPFVRNEGLEQIDGGIEVGHLAFTVECKWTKRLTARADVDVLMKKVERSPDTHMWGLLLSLNGWASTVERAIQIDRHTKNVILMDGVDLVAVLEGLIDLEELLMGKVHHSRWKSCPYVPASQLIAER